MADAQTEVINGSQDLGTIRDFVNLPEGSEVYPRLLPSTNIGTLAGVRKAIFEAGGLPALPFATKALMTASATTDGKYALVTDDTPTNNGLYYKSAGVWNKSGYDTQNNASSKVDYKDIVTAHYSGNLIVAATKTTTNFGLNGGLAIAEGAIYDSITIKVTAGDVLYMLNDKGGYTASQGAGFAFFADNPTVNKSQTRITDNRANATDTATGLAYQKVTVPAGASYLTLNTRYTALNTAPVMFNWAIHKDAFSNNYALGIERIVSIKDIVVAGGSGSGSGSTAEAIAAAKLYADTNKIDYKDIIVSYQSGNLLVSSSPKYTNLGLSSVYAISASTPYDSTIIAVTAGDVLYVLNDRGTYLPSGGGAYAFFAENPAVNTVQARITDNRVSETDATTSLAYQKVTVPVGAKFLMLNTRYTATGGAAVLFKWAVHKNAFSSDYTLGTEAISSIAGKPLPSGGGAAGVSKEYVDNQLLLVDKLQASTKNIYKGDLQTKLRTIGTGFQATASVNDTVSPYIPVTNGKYYSISGVPVALRGGVLPSRVLGFTSAKVFVKQLAVSFGDTVTVLIDDPTIAFIVFSVSDASVGATLEQAKALPIQVEEGQAVTQYQPVMYSPSVAQQFESSAALTDTKIKSLVPQRISNFTEMNIVRTELSTMATIARDLAPTGISYVMQGSTENSANNIFTKLEGMGRGKKAIYANVMKYIGETAAAGALKATAFNVPSGQLDNPDTLADYTNSYSKSAYVHPDIAYDVIGVAGFKYWMIASILPPNNMNDVVWEDEDMFVSNDAKSWQRIRSMYESDKTYTTATLRLPPQTLVTNNARKHAFLPCPSKGDTIEISAPADNGGAALDRVNITISELAWKHDPAILIDNGYVYTYHSFHLPYIDRSGGASRFVVCVRTNDGINWDVVRTDGSTMRLTEASSRTIFTKSADGKYNFMYYGYNRKYSNPNVVKYGEGDYELVYGFNYSLRFKGTTPYNFDFNTPYPFNDIGSTNHPSVFIDGAKTYVVNNVGVYESTDRGQTLTKLAKYPMWLGGVTGLPYKKSVCKGAGGKLIVVEAQRFRMQDFKRPAVNLLYATNDENLMYLYEYASVADFVAKATTGLVDAYIDVQLCKVNYGTQTREFMQIPAISALSTTTQVNRPLQRVKIADMTFNDGDILYIYVTLNSRNGAKIVFGGLDIN